MADTLITSKSNWSLGHASKQPFIIHQAFEKAPSTRGKSGISVMYSRQRFFFSSGYLQKYLSFSFPPETEPLTSNQARHEIMLSSTPQHKIRRHETQCKICFFPSLDTNFFSYLSTSKKFKLTYHLSSQEELTTSLTGALNNKICLSYHFFLSS